MKPDVVGNLRPHPAETGHDLTGALTRAQAGLVAADLPKAQQLADSAIDRGADGIIGARAGFEFFWC
jgi:hypothetical protein